MALQSSRAVGVVRHVGRLIDGCRGPVLFELVNDGDLLLLIERILHLRGLDTIRISKEKKEREEDARMDQLEKMILEGNSVSAADKEAWRRWARAGAIKRKRKKRRKRKLPRTSLRPAAPVPAVQARDHEFQFID